MSASTETNEALSLMITRLLAGPARPGQAFTMPGCTYGELYGMARRMRFFFDNHTDKDAPVCLCIEDRGIIAAALLASLAGGPPLLMPHALSPAALLDLQQLTGFTHAIAAPDDPLLPGVTAIDAHTLTDEVETLASDDANPDHPWVHLFTGGSTGAPRLWSKTPENLLGEVDYLINCYAVGNGDRILATVPAMHIYGLLYSLLLPLATSARVVAQTPSFPEEIKQQMADASPTIFISVPVHYRALKDHPPDRGTLRLAFSSAGPLAEADGIAFSESTGVHLVEVYGSTETGGIATRCRAQGKAGLTPYRCIQWRVAGDSLDIRSAFLSRELPIRNNGWFTVSDRVKRLGNDEFVVTGRMDSIVKVGGNRVDLEKIRQALINIDDVDDALVLANPAKTGRESEIMALVVGRLSVAEVRKALDNVLESHEKPRRLRMVDHIPMASTGKIDRHAIEKLIAIHPIDDEPDGLSVPLAATADAATYPVDAMVRRLTVTGRSAEPKGDNAPDSLVDWLSRQVGGPVAATTDIDALRRLAGYHGGFEQFTLVIHEETGIRRILEGTQTASLGFAVDLGTATMAGYLCDLKTGACMAADACINPQERIGEDIAIRINDETAHLDQRQRLAAEGINHLMTRCLEKAGAPIEAIDEVAVCGNTTMQQIFSGINPHGLGVSPFFPTTLTLPVLGAGDLRLIADPTVPVFLMPVISGSVGGDSMAAILADRPHERDGISLIVDIGTTCEVILGSRERLWVTSCATSSSISATCKNMLRSQPAKGALSTAIEFLMRKAGIEKIDRTILTGAFGTRFNGDNALAIDMLPTAVARSRVTAKDNLAGVGVTMALLDKTLRWEAHDLCRHIRYLKMAAETDVANSADKTTVFPENT